MRNTLPTSKRCLNLEVLSALNLILDLNMMNFSDTEDTRQEATKKIHNRELGYIWGYYTAD